MITQFWLGVLLSSIIWCLIIYWLISQGEEE
jgi:hypothetical protein